MYFDTKQKVGEGKKGTDVSLQIKKLRKFNSRYFHSYLEKLAVNAKVLLPEVDAERRWELFLSTFVAKRWSSIPDEFEVLVSKYPDYLKRKLPQQNLPDSVCFRLCEIHFEVASQIPLWPQYLDMLNSVIKQAQEPESKYNAIFYLGLSVSRDSTRENSAITCFRSILQENPEFMPPYFAQDSDVQGKYLFARASVDEINAFVRQPSDSLFLNSAEKYLNEALNLKPDFSSARGELAFIRKVYPFWRVYWDGLKATRVDAPESVLRPFQMFAEKTAADSGRVADYLEMARRELERRQPKPFYCTLLFKIFIFLVGVLIVAFLFFRKCWLDRRVLKQVDKYRKINLLVAHSRKELKMEKADLGNYSPGEMKNLRERIRQRIHEESSLEKIELQDFINQLDKIGFVRKPNNKKKSSSSFIGNKKILTEWFQQIDELANILYNGGGKFDKKIFIDPEESEREVRITIIEFLDNVPCWAIKNYSTIFSQAKRLGLRAKIKKPTRSHVEKPFRGKRSLILILKSK